MIPAHPLPPEPVTSVPMDAWQPPDLLFRQMMSDALRRQEGGRS